MRNSLEENHKSHFRVLPIPLPTAIRDLKNNYAFTHGVFEILHTPVLNNSQDMRGTRAY